MNGRAAAGPRRGQLGRDALEAALVAAAVADQDDVLEAVGLQAFRLIFDQRVIGGLAHLDRAGRGREVPGLERNRRRDQRIAELARDRFGGGAQHEHMLAGRHVWAVLLGAAGDDQGRGLAGLHRIADLHPRQLFDPHLVGGGDRPRRRQVEGAALRGRRSWRRASAERRRSSNESWGPRTNQGTAIFNSAAYTRRAIVVTRRPSCHHHGILGRRRR